MDKIVGFALARTPLVGLAPDLFGRGMTVEHIEHQGFHLCLWGWGKPSACRQGPALSMAFPPSDSLLERNLLLRLSPHGIEVENDWLGSVPVFYNPREGLASTWPRLALGASRAIDEVAVQDFLRYGYSVFGQTIFQDVRFLRHFSSLRCQGGQLREVTKDDDPAQRLVTSPTHTSEEDVWERFRHLVGRAESATPGKVLLPTSGGFDSRLLNLLLADKSKIRSFTYGASKDTSQFRDVVFARELSRILGTTWSEVALVDYHQHMPKWFKMYGFSTHYHGMYHLEFYQKIFQNSLLEPDSSMGSGIIGDAWSGKLFYKPVRKPDQVVSLGLSHGLSLGAGELARPLRHGREEEFLQENRNRLQLSAFRTLAAMRMKILLLSYLVAVPEHFGTPAWSPFLDFELVRLMLTLHPARRKNRLWQVDFFKRHGAWLEGMGLSFSTANRLDYDRAGKHRFEPLAEELLAPHVQAGVLRQINQSLKGFRPSDDFRNWLLTTPKIKAAAQMLGLRNPALENLRKYYVLKALQDGMTL